MSVYDTMDIAEWEAKQMNKGLFQITNTNKETDDSPEQWAVTESYFPTGICFECKDKETARELCEYLNILTQDLMLEQKLPEPLILAKLKDDVKPLATLLNQKADKLEELRTAITHELTCELDYLHKSNELKLKPEFIKEQAGLSKLPTEKQVAAFVEQTFSRDYDMWKIAKVNTSLIRQQLDFMNDRISLEKYALRLRE